MNDWVNFTSGLPTSVYQDGSVEFYGVVKSSGTPIQAASGDVITAEAFDRAAIASGRTMSELADLIGVSRSMVHTYRNDGVKRPRTVEQVRRVMGLWLRDDRGNVFTGFTDDDLLREVGRRMLAYREATTLRGEDEQDGELSSDYGFTVDEASKKGVIEGTLGMRPRSV